MKTPSEETAWRRKNAHRRCPGCGAYSLERVPGERLNPETHFPGVVYRVCGGCGWESPVRPRRRRGGLP